MRRCQAMLRCDVLHLRSVRKSSLTSCYQFVMLTFRYRPEHSVCTLIAVARSAGLDAADLERHVNGCGELL